MIANGLLDMLLITGEAAGKLGFKRSLGERLGRTWVDIAPVRTVNHPLERARPRAAALPGSALSFPSPARGARLLCTPCRHQSQRTSQSCTAELRSLNVQCRRKDQTLHNRQRCRGSLCNSSLV